MVGGVADVRDEELGSVQTLPAAGSSPAPAHTAALIGATLGRYRLERELGAGAMGVVYAAFDPDLERRIALKLLRPQAPSAELKERLLREARAMARLTHPNVVTVYEVGTTGGRDFVAMELIHGETLAEWLGHAPRRPAAILEAFLAAGRGLAAAHAAGMVHRDFKPHNVLRGRDGRIVVTDFGLAREAADAPPDAFGATLAAAGPIGAASVPSQLAVLTMTGALIGTPAYMAPEQWTGGAIGPATDQFAYCVALWEALAGERPYRGATFDELRAQVTRGPAALEAPRVPRRIRPILRRGLAPEAAARWPSMTALIARLERAQRRPRLALALAARALCTGGTVVALRGGAPVVPPCAAPAHDPASVWSPAIALDLRAKTSAAHAAALDDAYQHWLLARGAACRAAPQIQPAQLQCLDGVLARFDAVRQAYARVPAALPEDLRRELVVPALCQRQVAAEVPRLALAATPEVIAAYELFGRTRTPDPPSDAELLALLDKPALDPCARVIATIAFGIASNDTPRDRAIMDHTLNRIDRCDDDRLRAELLIAAVAYQRELPILGPRGEEAFQRAEDAVRRVQQPDLEAALAISHIDAERSRGRWDDALHFVDAAIAGYGTAGLPARQLRAVIARNSLRLGRSTPADLQAVIADDGAWRSAAAAIQAPALAATLDLEAMIARFWLGDVEGSHDELVRLASAGPRLESGSRELHGEVVDASGHPVAGARVAMARTLLADSVGVGLPMFDGQYSVRFATTDSDGRFAIRGGAVRGAIMAQHGARRSLPAPIADRVRLVLEPTRSISGVVELGGLPYTRVAVGCDPADDTTGSFHNLAPVRPDGSFTLSGVTVRAVRAGVGTRGDLDAFDRFEFRTLPASASSIANLRLAAPASQRILDVIARSATATALAAVEVVVLAGKHAIRGAEQLRQLRATAAVQTGYARHVTSGDRPRAVADKLLPGDLVAHLEHASQGELTVCAYAIPADLADHEAENRMQAQLAKLAVACQQIGAEASLVVVSVPPPPRLD